MAEGKRALIAPSILSADFARLGEEIRGVEAAGADWIHVDVMDGHFVPNITMGPLVAEAVRRATKLPVDCHLMIEYPEKYVDAFADAGADWITVHPEAKGDIHGAVARIRGRGCKAGLSINPDTPVSAALPFRDRIDMLLVMTVHPGFGGQKLIGKCLAKFAEARREFGPDLLLEVDGGVHEANAAEVRAAGAQCIVAGSAVFRAKDRRAVIAAIKG